MTSTRPRTPLGPRPQLRLYPQVGSAPISRRTRIIIRIVPIVFLLPDKDRVRDIICTVEPLLMNASLSPVFSVRLSVPSATAPSLRAVP